MGRSGREPVPIKITERAAVAVPATPPEPAFPAPAALAAQRVVVCRYCGHGHLYPCHGDDATCLNKAWTDQHAARQKAGPKAGPKAGK